MKSYFKHQCFIILLLCFSICSLNSTNNKQSISADISSSILIKTNEKDNHNKEISNWSKFKTSLSSLKQTISNYSNPNSEVYKEINTDKEDTYGSQMMKKIIFNMIAPLATIIFVLIILIIFFLFIYIISSIASFEFSHSSKGYSKNKDNIKAYEQIDYEISTDKAISVKLDIDKNNSICDSNESTKIEVSFNRENDSNYEIYSRRKSKNKKLKFGNFLNHEIEENSEIILN